jgi:hypothetical protein|tara:strand:- start:1366 stop:2556 length:1191 start_codon:yes stop_codon:yes gene_type:complete
MHNSENVTQDNNQTIDNITEFSSQILAEKFLSSINEQGYNDGINNKDKDVSGIRSSVRISVDQLKTSIAAKYEYLKKKIAILEEKLSEVKTEKEALKTQVGVERKSVRLFLGLLYTLSGILYILGDIEFSRQTIVVAWGLSKDSVFGQLSLVLGIAMATVLIKLFYERFIEARYEESKKIQDRLITGFFFCLAPLFIFFFLQIGWVRSVIFEYNRTTQIIDVYDALFKGHPYMNAIAFIGIAFMFLIGGAVLLSVGMKELNRYTLYYNNKKNLRKLENSEQRIKGLFDNIMKSYSVVREEHNYYADTENIELLIDGKTDVYIQLYTSGYFKGIREREEIEESQKQESIAAEREFKLQLLKLQNESLPDKNFHLSVRRILDNRIRKNNGEMEVLNHA